MPFPSINNSPIPNFPKPLDRKESTSKLVFPADLIYGKAPTGRNFYTQINFVDYKFTQQLNTFGAYAIPSGNGIKLPIPLRVNDNLTLHWSAVSFTNQILGGISGGALGLLAQAGSIATGQALNPLMFLQFQRPEYRQFSLSWLLSPRNEKESIAIKNIVTRCKQAASPTYGMILMGYPQVALIKMYPNDIFGHMVFKPCVINSVLVNYTGAPNPSFHKNGAPTMVSLTLNLTEMQFWFRNEIT